MNIFIAAEGARNVSGDGKAQTSRDPFSSPVLHRCYAGFCHSSRAERVEKRVC